MEVVVETPLLRVLLFGVEEVGVVVEILLQQVVVLVLEENLDTLVHMLVVRLLVFHLD